jgi:hypothetical protein
MGRNVEALLAFLAERSAMPHAIGRERNDCASFAIEAAFVQTGHDAFAGLSWTTLREGLRLLEREGGVEAALDMRFARITPAIAQRGDFAGVPDPEFGLHPMIVEGDTLVAPGARGLKRAPRRRMVAAWRVTEPHA